MSVHRWAERCETAEREVDALRARVRTLEGALHGLLDPLGPGGYLTTPGGPATRRAQAALSGAQPDTAPPPLNVRLRDLMRYMRAELFDAGLITQEEYVDLVSNTPGAVQRLEDYDAAKAKSDTAPADAEASIVELRRALEHIHESVTYNLSHKASVDMQRMIEAAVAQPAPQAALRAMLGKAVRSGYDAQIEDFDRLVDNLLKGES